MIIYTHQIFQYEACVMLRGPENDVIGKGNLILMSQGWSHPRGMFELRSWMSDVQADMT